MGTASAGTGSCAGGAGLAVVASGIEAIAVPSGAGIRCPSPEFTSFDERMTARPRIVERFGLTSEGT